MQLFVKTLDGKTITIEVELKDSIQIIKAKIGSKLKVQNEFISLIWSGKELKSILGNNINDNTLCFPTLSDYNYDYRNHHSIYARVEYDIVNIFYRIKLNAAKHRLVYARILKYSSKNIPIHIFNPSIMDDNPVKFITDNLYIANYINSLNAKLLRKKRTKVFLEFEISENYDLVNISNEINKLTRTIKILNEVNNQL